MCTEHFCKITCKRIIIIILLLLLWWRNRTLYTLLEAVVVVGGATAHVLSLLPQQTLLRCTRLSWRWDDDEEKRLARLQLLLPRQIIITNRNVTIKLAKPGRVVCKTSIQMLCIHGSRWWDISHWWWWRRRRASRSGDYLAIALDGASFARFFFLLFVGPLFIQCTSRLLLQ